jgi:hypothetical protein
MRHHYVPTHFHQLNPSLEWNFSNQVEKFSNQVEKFQSIPGASRSLAGGSDHS